MSPDYVSEPPQRRDNGLRADQFVALADVDPRLGEHLLDLLRLADIPAYLEPTTDPRVSVRYRSAGPVERLYVQADQRQQARAVVVAAAHEAGEAAAPEVAPVSRVVPPTPGPRDDVLFGVDTDAEFARIISGFAGPSAERPAPTPTPVTDETAAGTEIAVNDKRLDPASFVLDEDYAAVDTGITGADLDEAARAHARARRDAERQADLAEDEDEHFVPPPAPPFPTPSANTVGAVLLLILGVLVLLRGDVFGLGSTASFPVSILLLLAGSALIIRGLRDQPEPGDEPEDDGAEV